ncbi:hypothetical protein HRbin23_01555 [bacterium HR23]|nr:hypothetical protein HRbin23_01555 [bacterium HR23]
MRDWGLRVRAASKAGGKRDATCGGRASAKAWVKRWVTSAPSKASPTVPPTDRKSWVAEVAMPSTSWGTAFCTAMVKAGKVMPNPTPTTTMVATAQA